MSHCFFRSQRENGQEGYKSLGFSKDPNIGRDGAKALTKNVVMIFTVYHTLPETSTAPEKMGHLGN